MNNPLDLSGFSVRQVMAPGPVTVTPGHTVREVLRLMNRHRIGAVLVAEGGRLVGVFSERDLLRRAAEAEPGWRDRPVDQWMTRDPWTVSPDAGWEEATALMERLHVRHLPVLEDGVIVGILSARDLIARRAEHLNRLVEERTRDLQKAYDQLKQRDAELWMHMAVAGRLQARLLAPHAPPDWPEFTWGIHYAPLDPLGGDYYDFAQPDDRHLGILIADACGHSIPAALVAVMARTAFAAAASATTHPTEVLAAMNRHLHGLTEERFVTAFYGVLDRETRRFTYANAGHPYPLYLAAKANACRPLDARGFMLGILPEGEYEEKALTLDVGDRLVFYTDGVVDCVDAHRHAFGVERLEHHLLGTRHNPPSGAAERLPAVLAEFRGSRPATDDLTILVAEVRAGDP